MSGGYGLLENFQTGSGDHPASSVQEMLTVPSTGINPPGCEADRVPLVSRFTSGTKPALPICVNILRRIALPYTLSLLVRGSPGFELNRASVPASTIQQTVRSNKCSCIKRVCNGILKSFFILVLKFDF